MNTSKILIVCVSLLLLGVLDSNHESTLRADEKSAPVAAVLTPETVKLLNELTIQAKLTNVIGYVGTIAHPLPGDLLELKLGELPKEFLYLPRPSKDGQSINKKAAWIALRDPLVIEHFETLPKNHGGSTKIRLKSVNNGSKIVIQIQARDLAKGAKVHVIIYYENDDAPYGMAEAEGVLE
jgi:hypothetical protein